MRRALAIMPLLILVGCVHAQRQTWGGTGGVAGVGDLQANSSPVFKITTGSLPSGTLNQPGYTAQINAANGVPPYTCALTSGTLPGGLQLVGCSIIGTPTAPAGAFTFQITVTDSATPTASTATATYTINIGCPSVAILTPSTLPAGQQGTVYGPFQFLNTGGISPFTWSQSSGTLCGGLSLSAAGVLSGTPTLQQVCTFGVQVADSCNLGVQTASGLFQQQINTNIAITTTSPLPPATAGATYNQTLSVAGGTGPFSWTLQAGSVLPSGLTLTAAGVISGTTNTAGTFGFTVVVTDSLNATASASLNLSVSCVPLTITTLSPIASCTQGSPYPGFQMNSQGGFGAVSWSAPGLSSIGLSISTGGLITGTCTGVGQFDPTISVTDSCSTPQTASGAFEITMNQPNPLQITTGSLPNATVGQAYSSTTMAAQGGIPPYTWSKTVGSFPGGVTISSSGTVSGTVTTAGTFTPTITVTDTRNVTASQQFTITSTCPAMTFASFTMPQGTQNQAYNFALVASGGVSPLAYSIVNGSLPSGLSLNASTGVISGTPTATGIFPLTFQVKDSCLPLAQTIQQATSLTIIAALGITTTSPLPPATASVAYSTQLTAAGGTSPYTWSITAGSLPTGISLTAATGVISGTTNVAGTYTFTIKVTDNVAATSSEQFTLAVTCTPLSITSSATLPPGTQGIAYSDQLQSLGGTGTVTWSLVSGLPAGLTVSTTGLISGTPSVTGTFIPTISATDGCTTPQVVTQQFNLTINPNIGALVINTTSPLPSGTTGQVYNVQMSASGGVSPYTWLLTAGSLPAGLSISSGGAITGTPTTAQTTTPTIQVTDTQPVSTSQAYSITVSCPTLTITTTSPLPNARQSTAYSAQMLSAGGQGSVSWSGSSFPSGLSISSAGLISGTPSVSGSFTPHITATDSCSTPQVVSGNFALQVNTNLAITTSTPLPAATESVAYSTSISGAGGTPPYTFAVTSGALPTGLSLAASGVISGTPTATGTANFTVTLTDNVSSTIAKAFSMTVSCTPLSIASTSPLPGATQNSAYSFTFAKSGGTGTVTWAATGVPAGLSLSSGGVLSGTPTTPGNSTLSVTATDSCSPTPQTANGSFTITVAQAIAPLVITGVTLPQATAGVPYSSPVTATGGVPPYTFSLIGGSFPTGLSMNSAGTISGTATQAVTTSPVIQVTDTQPVSSSATFSITSVCPAITSSQPPVLPPGVINRAYSSQVQATGGFGTLNHSATGLPTGLTISSAGLISGTPTLSGSFAIVDTVSDQCSPTPQSFQINMTLQINTALAITTVTPLPNAQVGAAYSLSLHGSGGVTPYTWTVGTGLPGTLTLSSAGLLSGTPAVNAVYSFTVTLTDSASNSVTQLITLNVVPVSNTPALPDPTLLNWNTNIANTPSTGTVRCVGSPGVACGTTYATIQLAVAAAVCGDTIVLQNTQYVITGQLTFNLQCNASHWLTVTRDTSDTTFPAELSNVNPCYAGLASSTLVGLPSYTCNTPLRHMPQIIKSGNSANINVTCSYCRFNGIEWTRDNTYDLDNGIINMAITTCTTPNLACMNSMPNFIIFDRNIVHGDAQRQTTRGVSFSGTRWDAFINSYCYDIGLTASGGGGDAQCIQSGTGHNFTNVGFQKVINDFLSASTMPQLTGGAFTEPISPTTGFDGVPHDLWNAYWWAYKNPLWNTQIGQEPKAAQTIEGVKYPPANDQEFTVQPTALQLQTNQAFTFQLSAFNDSRQGINNTVGQTPTVTCGSAGACGTITVNGQHTVGTGIFASANQVTYTYTAPAAVPTGSTVTISFPFVTVSNISATLGNSRTITAVATVTIVTGAPVHTVAVGPAAPDLQMQPSYTDTRFNVRQFNMEFNAIANYTTTFTWSVDGVTNGNATVGTIQTQGSLALYTSSPTVGNHQICATAADSTKTCSTVHVSLTAPIVGFDLKAFTSKNGYEQKASNRVLFENSLIENCWGSTGNGGGQTCNLILLQPINQASQTNDGNGNNVGYGPEFNSDFTARYIKGEHISTGLVAVPLGAAKGTHRLSFTNILADDCDYTRWGNGFSKIMMGIQAMGTASTSVLGWQSSQNPPADNVTFNHITLPCNETNAFAGANNLAQFKLASFNFTNSIIESNGAATFVNPNGDTNDCNTASGVGANNSETNFFSRCVSPYTFNHLALMLSTACPGPTNCTPSVFVSSPITQPSVATVNFVNYNGGVNADWRLCKTSLGCAANSIYAAGQAQQASDGTDLGADVTGINTVESTIRGTITPPVGTTFYISPTGNDANNGLTTGAPFKTFSHAFPKLTPGSTLILENGSYGPATGTGFPIITCSSGGVNNGVLSSPITIQAQNERQAHIVGDGSAEPFQIHNCTYWNVIGLYVSDIDDAVQNENDGTFALYNSSHLLIRRNILNHPNRCFNLNLLFASAVTNSTFEENELYFFHRWGIQLWQGANGNEVRRNYANPRGAFAAANATCTTYGVGPAGIGPYHSNNNTFENNIVESSTASDSAGFDNEADSSSNSWLGNVVNKMYFILAAHQENPQPTGNLWNNDVSVLSQTAGFWMRGGLTSTLTHDSIFGEGSSQLMGFGLNPGLGSNSPTGYTGGFGMTVNNSQVQNMSGGDGAYFIANNILSGSGPITFSYDHDNNFNNGTTYNPNSNVTNPLVLNPAYGTCYLFAPAGSPLIGAASDGSTVGATVLFQYSGGNLTTTKLWNSSNGAPLFAGQTVTGLNDQSGSSLFDVANRLNINQNGCSLPAGY